MSVDKRYELNRIVKESIVQSLFLLMRQKPFSDITVTNIIEKAGVARASYYRNFYSKEAILRDYVYEIIQNCKKEIPYSSGRLTYENLCLLFNYIAHYSELLKTLFHSGLSGLFLDSLNLYFQETRGEVLQGNFNIWTLYAYSGALFNIINKWIEEDMRQSPEEIAKSFYSIWELGGCQP